MQFRHVPAGEDVAAAGRVVLQAVDQLGHLIERRIGAETAVFIGGITRPAPPLHAIDGPQIAPFRGKIIVGNDPRFEIIAADGLAGRLSIGIERPVGPDMHALFHKRADVRFAVQEPDQLLHSRFPEHALGGEQRHRAIGKIEFQRLTKQGARAGTGAVAAHGAGSPHTVHQGKILVFAAMSHCPLSGIWRARVNHCHNACEPH